MVKRGQPTKMTVLVIDKLKQAFAFDATVEEACSYAEIAKQTYYTFIKSHPKILDEFQAQREKPVLIARQSVINKMKEDGHLALKYLERKKKDEFSLRSESLIANVSVDDLIGELKKLDADILQDQEQTGGAGSVQAE